MERCLTYSVLSREIIFQTDQSVCDGAAVTLCKKKIGNDIPWQWEILLMNLWKLCNISDEGYGNFNLFSDKQLKAEIESSSRDSDLENSLTIEVV